MLQSLERVMDAVNAETLWVCKSEAEGRGLMLDIHKGFGFTDVDVVFAEFEGPGVRIRGPGLRTSPSRQILMARADGEVIP